MTNTSNTKANLNLLKNILLKDPETGKPLYIKDIQCDWGNANFTLIMCDETGYECWTHEIKTEEI